MQNKHLPVLLRKILRDAYSSNAQELAATLLQNDWLLENYPKRRYMDTLRSKPGEAVIEGTVQPSS